MIRLLLLIALVIAATYLVEAVVRQVRRQLGEPGAGERARFRYGGPAAGVRRGPDPPVRAAELVACSRCGVHIPTSGALWRGEAGPYCSEACRRQAMTSP